MKLKEHEVSEAGQVGEPGRRSTRRPGTARAPAARPPPAAARSRRRSPWRRPQKRRELSGGPVVERVRIVPSGAGNRAGSGKAQGRIRTRRGGAVSQVVEPEETEQRRRNGAGSGSRRQAVWLVR
jgi:hypothetical protein